ncbi:MAG: hypothetical protein KDC92_14590 [Bacteroidetes bacterium]|nr:hypothetical protein [Bacteroidota bacterium]
MMIRLAIVSSLLILVCCRVQQKVDDETSIIYSGKRGCYLIPSQNLKNVVNLYFDEKDSSHSIYRTSKDSIESKGIIIHKNKYYKNLKPVFKCHEVNKTVELNLRNVNEKYQYDSLLMNDLKITEFKLCVLRGNDTLESVIFTDGLSHLDSLRRQIDDFKFYKVDKLNKLILVGFIKTKYGTANDFYERTMNLYINVSKTEGLDTN